MGSKQVIMLKINQKYITEPKAKIQAQNAQSWSLSITKLSNSIMKQL